MFRVIAIVDKETMFNGTCLVAYSEEYVNPKYYFDYKKCWIVNISSNGEIKNIQEHLVWRIPSYFNHTQMFFCDLDCPKHIEEALIPLINVNEFSEEEMSMEDRPFIASLKRMRDKQESKEMERN